jgi:two-component system response regulator HydG
VPLLAAAFLRRFAEKNARRTSGFTPAALAALEAAPWPGNVRELMHAVERAVILAPREVIEVGDLPEAVRGAAAASPPVGGPATLSVPLGTSLDEIERLVIRETLRQARGDKTLAAQLLGIAPRTIYRKLDRDEAGRLVDAGDGPADGGATDADPAGGGDAPA